MKTSVCDEWPTCTSCGTSTKRKKVKQPLESWTEGKSIEYACGKKVRGRLVGGKDCVHYKLNGLGRMGKPDQLFVTPNGYTWFVEFKREGEEPTELQKREADAVTNRWQLHSFIYTLEEFKFKLEWVLRLPRPRFPSDW